MIIATADSNIYISALNFGGVPLEFLNAARAGGFRLAISGALITEIRNVLSRKFGWPEEAADDAVLQILDFSVCVRTGFAKSWWNVAIIEQPTNQRLGRKIGKPSASALGKWSEESESPGDDTVLTQTLQSVRRTH